MLIQSASQVRRLVETRFPGVKIPSRSTVHNLYNKFQATGSVEPKKQHKPRSVLTEETLDDICHRLEQSSKSLRLLSQQVGIPYGSGQKATKFKLHPYKITKTHALQPGDPARRRTFCERMLNFHNGLISVMKLTPIEENYSELWEIL